MYSSTLRFQNFLRLAYGQFCELCSSPSRVFCQNFFEYYNKEHHHSGIGLVTPEQLHYGLAQEVYDQRCSILKNAFERNPERFRGKIPQPPALPEAAWINKPKPEKTDVIRV